MFPPEGQSPEWDLDTEYNMDSICVLYDSGEDNIAIAGFVTREMSRVRCNAWDVTYNIEIAEFVTRDL